MAIFCETSTSVLNVVTLVYEFIFNLSNLVVINECNIDLSGRKSKVPNNYSMIISTISQCNANIDNSINNNSLDDNNNTTEE